MPIGRYERELTKLLDTARGERQIHAYLKTHADLVLRAFNVAWNAKFIFSEFKVGTDFRADFLILSADSGGWHAIFIELESHRARLYHKDGRPTKALQIAQRQLAEWQDHVRQFDDALRHQFAKLLDANDVHAKCSVKYSSAADEIRDRRMWLRYDYHVVIGRSRHLSEEEQQFRQQDNQYWGGRAIATYDRLLHFARTSDNARRELLELWKREGKLPPANLRRRPLKSIPSNLVM